MASRLVSIATAPFRNGGWSTSPTGSVSRSCRDRDDLDAVGRREEVRRPEERHLARAEVRAEPDVRARHAASVVAGAERSDADAAAESARSTIAAA